MSDEKKSIKDWKDYTQLLKLLLDRGMQINDYQCALHYLENVGYYRLSGYWYSFRQKDHQKSNEKNRLVLLDSFQSDTTFSDIIALYCFDKELRLLTLDALESIEMAVRNSVVHLLGELHPLAHINPYKEVVTGEKTCCLHPNFVNKNGRHAKWLEKHNALILRSKKQEVIRHHCERYDGVVPIWAAAEVWDFGLLSQLFAGMRYNDKNTIAKKYNVKDGKTFEKWLRSFNFIRNVCAHHGRLWNVNMTSTVQPSGKFLSMNQYRVFMYFCMMQQMLLTISSRPTWFKRICDLLKKFPEPTNKAVSVKDMGLSDDWEREVGLMEITDSRNEN